MNVWHDLPKERVGEERFQALIEIPKGSKAKYEMDKETGCLKLDRILYTSTVYPANYGFIPHTLGDDGDPLDVLILCNEAIFPMTLVDCKPIGVIRMIDGGDHDEKILAVPVKDPTYSGYKDISDLPAHIYEELMHFFEVYKALEYKITTVREVQHKDKAMKLIRRSIQAYEEWRAESGK
ncbi:MAG: inorganic diphosphatase [Clostridia bacterium]|nr:inorganic diphosphatase [Clostridia bacterium]